MEKVYVVAKRNCEGVCMDVIGVCNDEAQADIVMMGLHDDFKKCGFKINQHSWDVLELPEAGVTYRVEVYEEI